MCKECYHFPFLFPSPWTKSKQPYCINAVCARWLTAPSNTTAQTHTHTGVCLARCLGNLIPVAVRQRQQRQREAAQCWSKCEGFKRKEQTFPVSCFFLLFFLFFFLFFVDWQMFLWKKIQMSGEVDSYFKESRFLLCHHHFAEYQNVVFIPIELDRCQPPRPLHFCESTVKWL